MHYDPCSSPNEGAAVPMKENKKISNFEKL
jgi:hypothetical protein